MEPQTPERKPARKATRVGAEMDILRWMLRNANKRAASVVMIREGLGHDVSGDMYNLKKLGVIERLGWGTYQIAPEFRDAPMPKQGMRYTSQWIKMVREQRAAAGEEWTGKPKPFDPASLPPIVPEPVIPPTHEEFTVVLPTFEPLSDDDLLAVLDLLIGGTIALSKIALVSEWMELTRKLVAS